MKTVVLAVCLMFLFGCAAQQVGLLAKTATLSTSGQNVDILVAETTAAGGLNQRVTTLYDEKGKLIFGYGNGGDGALTQFFAHGFQGVAQAGGLVGLGLTMRATQINNAVGGGAGGNGGFGGQGGSFFPAQGIR